jgi:tetratricopeptide (TPR) repeat protein
MFRVVNRFLSSIARSSLELLDLFGQVPRKMLSKLIGSRARRPWWKTLLLLPLLLPYWLWQGLAYPLSFKRIGHKRRRYLLLGLPALAALLLFSTAMAVRHSAADKVEARYLNRMQTALNDGDFKLASVLGSRIISMTDNVEPRLLFHYALAIDNLGETQRARSIITGLAPDNRIGYPAAHLVRAVAAYSDIQVSSDPTKLQRLRWHLENSGKETSEQKEQLWAFYHSAVGETGEATRHLEQAAKFNPAHWLTLAEIYRQLGNTSSADRSLRSAEQDFQRMLKADPTSRDIRIQLALALTKLKRVDEAEEVLQVGLKLHKDASTLRSVADFYLMRFDLDSQEKADFAQRFAYLQKAIELDIHYQAIYTRLINIYAEKQLPDNAKRIRDSLEAMVSKGESSALAHFTLSSFLLVDGQTDDALWHLQQSFRLDDRFTVVGNNLAWVLAASEPPRLDEALELAEQAVNASPTNSHFRDTLGTVLMKQGKLDEASAELEKALPGSPEKGEIHVKLAEIYQKLGGESLSAKHEALAKASKRQ